MRPKLQDRIKKQRGESFADVLEQYRNRSPEEVAAEFGCSLQTLMREAEPFGFRIVTTRRIERVNT